MLPLCRRAADGMCWLVVCRSRSLRTPANIFIINLAVADLLMCVTQTPVFFTTSMFKRWIFGEKGEVAPLRRARVVSHGSEGHMGV